MHHIPIQRFDLVYILYLKLLNKLIALRIQSAFIIFVFVNYELCSQFRFDSLVFIHVKYNNITFIMSGIDCDKLFRFLFSF